MKVLMVGVDKQRFGGMWTVANNYIENKNFNEKVELEYIATSTNGSALKRFIFMIKGIYKIKRALKKENVDIVHIHMAEKGSTFRKGYVAKLSKNNNCKVVIQLHAGPFMAWYNSLKLKKQKKVTKIFGYADRILVLGEYWKKELATIIDERKLDVLYNGVTIPKNNLYNISNKNIVYMGVLKKEKGIYDLINSISIINDKLPQDIKVLLCGNDLEGNIFDIIREKKLEKRIEMLGWIDEEEKDKVYKSALISVLPSYFEALSMTIIEAMSYGVPVITTDISTMREILGEKAILISPGNVNLLAENILRLVNDKETLDLLSKDEYRRVNEKFSVENNIDTTINIYKQVMESGKK